MSRPLELILARQWAALLSVPVLIFDAEGALVFFNEPAGLLLGRKYDEVGVMVPAEWQSAFPMESAEGRALPPAELPMERALRQDLPVQVQVSVRAMDGVRRKAVVTAFPIRGLQRASVGVMTLVNGVA